MTDEDLTAQLEAMRAQLRELEQERLQRASAAAPPAPPPEKSVVLIYAHTK